MFTEWTKNVRCNTVYKIQVRCSKSEVLNFLTIADPPPNGLPSYSLHTLFARLMENHYHFQYNLVPVWLQKMPAAWFYFTQWTKKHSNLRQWLLNLFRDQASYSHYFTPTSPWDMKIPLKNLCCASDRNTTAKRKNNWNFFKADKNTVFSFESSRLGVC